MKPILCCVIFLFLSASSANLFAQRVVNIGAKYKDAKTVNIQSGVFVKCVAKNNSIIPLSKLIYANDSVLFLRDSSVYIKNLSALIVYKHGRLVTRIGVAASLAVPTAIPFYVPLREGTWFLYGFPIITTIPFLVSTFNVFRNPMFCDLRTTSIKLKLNLNDEFYSKSLIHYDYYQNRIQSKQAINSFVAPRVYLVSKKSSNKTLTLLLPQSVKLKTANALKIKGRMVHLTDTAIVVQRAKDTILVELNEIDQIKVINPSHGWAYVCYGLSLNGAYNAINYSESVADKRYTLPLSIYSSSLAILGYVISPKWRKMKDHKLSQTRE